MAGIGFELKKIYGKKTLGGNLWGTFYAAMTTLGPAALSIILIFVANMMLDWGGATQMENRFFISTITYALLTGLLVSSALNTVVSRYISDCVFNSKEEDIWASAFGVLTLGTVISGSIMLLICARLYYLYAQMSMPLIVGYYFLGVLVTDTYCIMNYVSAMNQYKYITRVYLLGMLAIVAMHVVCVRKLGMSSVTAGYFAIASCYFIMLLLLMILGIRTLGISRNRYFSFLGYFKKYPLLAITGFVYMLSLYFPTLIYWLFSSMRESISFFYTTPAHDQAMFLALIINMPSMVIFVVKVETAFYEKYVLYVSALNGGPYSLIEKERVNMARVISQQLFFVYEVQLMITVVLVCLANVFLPYFGIRTQVLNMFNVMSMGIYTVFCLNYTVIVLHYFADYAAAFIGVFVFLAVTILFTAIALYTAFYSLPLLAGGISGWACTFLLLRGRIAKLNRFLMCK